MEYDLSSERLEGTQLSSLKASRAADLALKLVAFHGGCLVPDDAMKFLRHGRFHQLRAHFEALNYACELFCKPARA